ncbi:MAG: metallophosphoesterase family protein [Flavobacteriales bacterium]|nr:metallophosphoesterase family protein [Flavobacteriales bacterium]MBK7087131.1 metallophosphoesterase family protein [Flavobacteriales bacterium]MBK7753808.1 metallophosphoesterase family protein [Flavobacteriales bacterium]
MSRIGLLSDTHGWLDPRIQEHFAGCDEIWHAGDLGGVALLDELRGWFPKKPIRAVWGNIDDATVRRAVPEHQRFELDGVRVWMTHIGGRPPRYDPTVLQELRSAPPTLFICGHSHICMVKFDPALKMLYMNPGACGRHGWHVMRTVLRFTLEAGQVKDLEVVELGKRGS